MKQILSQQMKLSPQQVMLSSLLQLPITALEQRLKQELEQNPLLEESQELEELQDEEMELEQTQEKPELKQEQEKPEDVAKEEEVAIQAEKDKEKKEEEEVDWAKILNDDSSFEIRMPRGQGEDDDDQEWIQPDKISLSDHLLEQLRWTSLTEEQRRIAEYIIWNLNEDGYFVMDDPLTGETPIADEVQRFTEAVGEFRDDTLLADKPDEPAEESERKTTHRKKTTPKIDAVQFVADEFQTTAEAVEKILKTIHTFDPPGIGARHLKECILIQLYRRKESDGFYQNGTDITIRIMHEAYEDFINRRYDKVAKMLNIPIDAIKHSISEVLSINPKPGEGYITPEQNYITPDAAVKKIDGKFEIILNDYDVPHLRINNAYKRMMLERNKTGKETKDFIKNKLEAAKWLINSLYRRRDTIYRTIESIVELQQDFFEKGVHHIKPMKLEDVAVRIGMDISTISRATNGKYVQTDYGVFELKYFFSTAMTNSDGEDVSTKQIKTLLKEVIDQEDKRHPYSDEELAKVLTERGTPIARRTITKYREQMMIPSGRLRKQI